MRVRTPIAQHDKALLTRNEAIGTSQEGSYLLVVGPDNVVQRKIVTTGVRDGQLRVIESGLTPDDWVVTEGVQRAFPGAKVDPQRGQLASAEPGPAGAKSQPGPAARTTSNPDKTGAADRVRNVLVKAERERFRAFSSVGRCSPMCWRSFFVLIGLVALFNCPARNIPTSFRRQSR